ncbi:hypothetical protein Tco_0142015, partial [Tanacetum coccineum]
MVYLVDATSDPNVATTVPSSVSALNEGTVLSRAFGLNNSGLTGPTSYAKLVTKEPSMKSANFCTLLAPTVNRADVAISLESVRAFNSKDGMDGMDAMLENGPWFIRITPFILKNDDGLSAITTKLGNPLKLDSYTSDMCMQSCGRLSYAKAMIEVQASVELKDAIVVAML